MVAGRFMPFGGGPACSWTRFHSRSRISWFKVMKAEPAYFSGTGLRQQGECRLARLALDAQ
ncbi:MULTISPECIES: hypothetical protein [unclassified Mesorhizobium]|uniref:hypothetical protein n=1 Tax=unclassified Mesorhizobium TaxID=325217 RepID=UPI00333DBB52